MLCRGSGAEHCIALVCMQAHMDALKKRERKAKK